MYVYHKDIPNNQWNVFEIVDGHEIYICSFTTAEKAQSYCKLMNDDIAIRVQIAKLLEPICTGTDPIRCDGKNCPVHGEGVK